MTCRSRLLLPALLLACAGRGGAGDGHREDPPLRVDGSFYEWADVPVAATDGRDVDGPDLREVRLTADARALHLLLDFDAPLNLQSMAATVRLAFDGDGDPQTGERVAGLPGADIVIELSAPVPGAREGTGMRVRLAGDTAWQPPAAIDLEYAPTHASGRFEVALGRTHLTADTLRGIIVMTDGAGGPVEVFGPFATAAPSADTVALRADATVRLARDPATHLRVVVWNVGDTGPLRRPEPYRRILRALEPDVVLLDELNVRLDHARVLELMPEPAMWTVHLGAAGGRQRTAVASRLPIEVLPDMAHIAWPDSIRALEGEPLMPQIRADLATGAADGVPAMGAVVRAGGRRVLLVPVDLPCCGRIGSAEDRARIMMADAVNAAARRALRAGDIDAVVIGGDLNLVGSRGPLTTLAAALDPDGGPLMAAELLTPDRATYSTWRNPRGPFPPGRLDWVLYSASTLEQVGGMIVDGDRLAPAVLAAAGIEAGDTRITDHLPLVVDLAFRARPTR